MTRLHILLTAACVTGAAAALAPTSPERASPKLPAAGVAPVTTTAAAANGQLDQVAWLARYGSYNVRQGSWNLFPNPNGC